MRDFGSICRFNATAGFSIFDRPPDNDFKSAVLFDINNVYRSIRGCPFVAGLCRGRAQLLVALGSTSSAANDRANCTGGHACDAST